MYCKHQINYHHKDNKNNFKQMFQWELAFTAVLAHNVHEDKHTGWVQEEGTDIICFGVCMGYIKKVQRDEAELGSWSWILMGGTNRHIKSIITVYNLCKNKTSTQVPCISNNDGFSVQGRKTLPARLSCSEEILSSSCSNGKRQGIR